MLVFQMIVFLIMKRLPTSVLTAVRSMGHQQMQMQGIIWLMTQVLEASKNLVNGLRILGVVQHNLEMKIHCGRDRNCPVLPVLPVPTMTSLF